MAKIIGNTTATPNPRPDWAQVDETKADYIKNKPTLEGLATETYVDDSIAENNNKVASAITNTISGGEKSLTINNVSPLEHKCSCKLTSDTYEAYVTNSKNIFDASKLSVGMYQDTSAPNLIIDIGTEGNGSFTASGKIPPYDTLYFNASIKNLVIGNQYTISVRNSKNETISFRVLETASDGSGVTEDSVNKFYDTSYTFIHGDKEGVSTEYIILESWLPRPGDGETEAELEETTYYIQVEEGTQMTDWVPAGGTGKNIYKFDSENMKINFDDDTLSKTYNDNGTLTLNGYTNEGISVEFYLRNLTVGETYTFSLKPYGVLFIEKYNQNHERIGDPILAENDVVTFTHTDDVDYYFAVSNSFGANEDDPFVNLTFYPQLELGTVATEWEEYTGVKTIEKPYIKDFSTITVKVGSKSYTPLENGTVTNIESISPTMEITTDNEHVNICDFTYCVDTKKYVDNNVTSADFIIVTNELPETGEPNKLYLVPKADSQEQDLFDEFIWVNNTWEWITTKQIEVDLTDYVKNTDYATKDKAGVIKINSIHGVSIYNGELMIERANASEIAAKKLDRNPITPAYLDIAVKTGVTTNTIPLTEEEKASACEWLGVDGLVGDIDEALDEIIEIQESLKDGYTGGTGGVSSWNDLTDKPFYDEGIKTATLDYNNLPDIKISPSDELTFYKVTDDILNESILNGSQITAVTTNANGETVSNSLEISGFPASNEFEFGKVFANVITEGLIFFVAIATKTGQFEVDGSTIEVAETGTYFSLMSTSGETPNLMSLEYNYLKSLDIKFIPNELYTEIDKRIENYINEALGGDY